MHSYESVIRASMERDQGRDLRAGWTRALDTLWWVVRFLVALFLFVGALQLMKTGAKSLDVLQPGGFLVKNAASTFGLGWLGAHRGDFPDVSEGR
jgi:hypothetical protein